MFQDKIFSRRKWIQWQRQWIPLQKNDNQLYNLLKKTIFLFQTYKVMRESPHMFDIKNNKSMNNAITHVAPKSRIKEHSMSLNNMISCVVGISIFGFRKYWQRVFILMELSMSPTFKKFLLEEAVNADKKAYYQLYNVKIMRAFHKQEMRKHQI